MRERERERERRVIAIRVRGSESKVYLFSLMSYHSLFQSLRISWNALMCCCKMEFSRDYLSSDFLHNLLHKHNLMIFGLYGIIGFILLSIVLFCTLFVYEHFFWTKKIKNVRKKHVVVSVI